MVDTKVKAAEKVKQVVDQKFHLVVKHGANVTQKTPQYPQGAVGVNENAKKLQQTADEEGGEFIWRYYVDDGVDGKSTGWFPFGEDAIPNMEKAHTKWHNGIPFTEGGKVVKRPKVQSKSDAHTEFFYLIDFDEMKQENSNTNKVRTIRRLLKKTAE